MPPKPTFGQPSVNILPRRKRVCSASTYLPLAACGRQPFRSCRTRARHQARAKGCRGRQTTSAPALLAPAQISRTDGVHLASALPVVVPVFGAAALSTTIDGADGGVAHRGLHSRLLGAFACDARTNLVAAGTCRVLLRRTGFGWVIPAVGDGAARVAVAGVASHSAPVGELSK
eukprot:COSAG02_NODE_628_length_19343_cov_15.829297_17_plen_174_part_00